MKRILTLLIIGLLGLLIVPILLAQFGASDGRRFEGVELEETDYQEVHFWNTEQGLSLAGMLFIPDGQGPFPGAVIIHGSGASHRDNSWYLTLTQYLQKNGVVVLLPDKRGSEESQGEWRGASFEDLATDTLAAVSFLRSQDRVPISYIGLVGMSQGGRIAPIAANQSDEISFIVNVVGGALPAYDSLVYEENHNLREMGILPGLSNLLAYPAAWSLVEVRQTQFWDAVGNFDPIPYWEGVEVDSLILYGQEDTNVASSRSADRLRALGKANIDVRIYAGSGHALESPQGAGKSIFREDALSDIRDFIHAIGEED
jgi:dienelactone hydrolase